MKLKPLITTLLIALIAWQTSFSRDQIALSKLKNTELLNKHEESLVAIDSPTISITPTYLDERVFRNTTSTRTVTITNYGSEAVELNVTLNIDSLQMPEGNENGEDARLFAVDGFDYDIIELDPVTGDVLNRFTPPGQPLGPDGLAYDGESLYFFGAFTSDHIYKINPDNGDVLDSLFVPQFFDGIVAGLGYSEGSIYGISLENKLIYKVDFETGIFSDPIALEAAGPGLTYAGNRGTMFGFGSETDDFLVNNKFIFEIDPETGEEINSFAPPTDDISFGMAYSKSLNILFVEAYPNVYALNPDDGSVLYQFESVALYSALASDEYRGLSWLEFDTSVITLMPGESHEIEVTFNANGVVEGLYEAGISFRSSEEELYLPVNLEVLRIVEDLNVESVCSEMPDVSKRWEIINPNEYNVEIEWQLLNTDISGIVDAQPGSTFFFTNPGLESPTGQLLRIKWVNEQEEERTDETLYTNEACAIRGLTLNPVCTPNPELERRWTALNPNQYPIRIFWSYERTTISGELVVPPGESEFSTPLSLNNEPLRMKWFDQNGNARRQKKEQNSTPCKIRGLTLTAEECSPNPALSRFWQVFNPNAFSVDLEWVRENSNQRGTFKALPGSSLLVTPGNIGEQKLRIIWYDEQGNPRRQRKVSVDITCELETAMAHDNNERNVANLGEAVVSSYPNPFIDEVNVVLRVEDTEDQEYTVLVYNMMGNIVFEGTAQASYGQVNTTIDASSFAKGNYILTVYSAQSKDRYTNLIFKN